MNTAVLIIDMQNAFFEAEPLASQQDRVVTGCNELIRAARESGTKVMMVCTEHERDKSTWTLSMLDDDQGFIFSGSEQAQFVPGLDWHDLPRVVKIRDSAFVATDLLLRLRNWNVDRLILAGVASHNCVAQTAADAFAHNFHVVYAVDAMASTDEHAADEVLAVLSAEYRQPQLSAAEIRDLLASNTSPTTETAQTKERS
jgi:nicotinamidase-related amidase